MISPPRLSYYNYAPGYHLINMEHIFTITLNVSQYNQPNSSQCVWLRVSHNTGIQTQKLEPSPVQTQKPVFRNFRWQASRGQVSPIREMWLFFLLISPLEGGFFSGDFPESVLQSHCFNSSSCYLHNNWIVFFNLYARH